MLLVLGNTSALLAVSGSVVGLAGPWRALGTGWAVPVGAATLMECLTSCGDSCTHLSISVTYSRYLIDHAASLDMTFFFSKGFTIIMTSSEADYASHKER